MRPASQRPTTPCVPQGVTFSVIHDLASRRDWQRGDEVLSTLLKGRMEGATALCACLRFLLPSEKTGPRWWFGFKRHLHDLGFSFVCTTIILNSKSA